jgi:hypothetical protein
MRGKTYEEIKKEKQYFFIPGKYAFSANIYNSTTSKKKITVTLGHWPVDGEENSTSRKTHDFELKNKGWTNVSHVFDVDENNVVYMIHIYEKMQDGENWIVESSDDNYTWFH